MIKISVHVCCLLAVVCSGLPSAFAQQQQRAPQQQVQQQPQQPKVAMPKGSVQLMLIRNCLTALNHASITGNYSVLRDLSSDRFRQKHQAADLARTFQTLSSRKIDLSPVLVNTPKLLRAPAISNDGRLRLKGMVPTKPLAVEFDLIYQYGARGWAIDEIGLQLSDAATIQQASHQQTQSRPAANRQPTTAQRNHVPQQQSQTRPVAPRQPVQNAHYGNQQRR